uniref:Uncharacterized protein n=1 Tax=Cacopsylla melanoneura TaxID=428564 RepID=A0A8D9E6K1_9HEMI
MMLLLELLFPLFSLIVVLSAKPQPGQNLSKFASIVAGVDASKMQNLLGVVDTSKVQNLLGGCDASKVQNLLAGGDASKMQNLLGGVDASKVQNFIGGVKEVQRVLNKNSVPGGIRDALSEYTSSVNLQRLVPPLPSTVEHKQRLARSLSSTVEHKQHLAQPLPSLVELTKAFESRDDKYKKEKVDTGHANAILTNTHVNRTVRVSGRNDQLHNMIDKMYYEQLDTIASPKIVYVAVTVAPPVINVNVKNDLENIVHINKPNKVVVPKGRNLKNPKGKNSGNVQKYL